MKHFPSIVAVCLLGMFLWLGILQAAAPGQRAVAQPQSSDRHLGPSSSMTEPLTGALSQTMTVTAYLPLIVRPESTISGHILDGLLPVPGVLISTSTGRTGTTDAAGTYQIYVPDETQLITPTLAGYTFSPTVRLVTIPPSAQNQDFEATPPPCAARTTIFFDDFSNPSSGWGEVNNDVWEQHYSNGEYEAILKVNTQLLHAAPGVAGRTGNFIASANMRQTDTPDYGDGYGLWIGSPTLDKYYEFSVSTNTIGPSPANYGVTYYDGNEPIWHGKVSGTSSAVNLDNGVNALRVHRCGTRYYFYANNTLLTSVILTELANQALTAGFYARNVATYRLDNFTLQTAP